MTATERSFFAYKTDHGYVLSIAQKKGRKNYSLEKAIPKTTLGTTQATTEKAPLAIESFAVNPEHYHALMERIEHLHQKRAD